MHRYTAYHICEISFSRAWAGGGGFSSVFASMTRLQIFIIVGLLLWYMQNFENNTNISDRFALLGVASEWMISELANTMITVPYWVSSFCKKKKKKGQPCEYRKNCYRACNFKVLFNSCHVFPLEKYFIWIKYWKFDLPFCL